MPRGHLKHQRGISRKAARGGASRGRSANKNYLDIYNPKSREHIQQRNVEWSMGGESVEDDMEMDHPMPIGWTCSSCTYCNDNLDYLACAMCGTERNDTNDLIRYSDEAETLVSKQDTADNTNTGTCSICCEENVPLIRLMEKACRQHEPACYECLRRLYVTDAQQSVANFPLRCYHPRCQAAIRETQLARHQLCVTKAEFTKHFRLTELSKGYQRRGETETAYCPRCDQPRTFCSSNQRTHLYRSVRCRNCDMVYVFPENAAVAKVLEEFGGDRMGGNDGWAPCPKCKVLISKGDGCDHMRCGVCKTHFSWQQALSKKAKTTPAVATRVAPPPLPQEGLLMD